MPESVACQPRGTIGIETAADRGVLQNTDVLIYDGEANLGSLDGIVPALPNAHAVLRCEIEFLTRSDTERRIPCLNIAHGVSTILSW